MKTIRYGKFAAMVYKAFFFYEKAFEIAPFFCDEYVNDGPFKAWFSG